jgi:tight adherence protein C
MELLAILAVFGTVFLLVLALGGGDRRVYSRLDMIRGPERARDEEGEPTRSLGQRVFVPLGQAAVGLARRVLPTPVLEGIQQRLVIAGEPMTLSTFMVFQLMTPATFVAFPVLVVLGAGLTVTPITLLAMGGLGLGGALLPNLWLSQRVGQRQHQIIKSLPDSFDLITTCVEAGLGLDAALARVAEKVEGPFSDELRRALRDVALGKSRRDALRELGDRTGVPDLLTFVSAVIQAEQMGSSIGAVLRVQSEQMRVRRRQRAEEQAYKAPVKMIFPLVLCIFPTLFIVILGPAVITIMRDFPG